MMNYIGIRCPNFSIKIELGFSVESQARLYQCSPNRSNLPQFVELDAK